MDLYRDNVAFNVGIEFDVMVYVPFAEADTEIEAVVSRVE